MRIVKIILTGLIVAEQAVEKLEATLGSRFSEADSRLRRS